jgi:hypothetical protein
MREKIAHVLILLASKLCPHRPGYCFVKNLFDGCCIIDGCLIRQSVCRELKNGVTWETWTLPEEFWNDLKKQ